jgi:ADP-heptose:LPS heptosyltransferase
MAPRFTVSVLCMNHLDLTVKCIESVLKHSKDFELIVTDNASSDGTPKYLDEVKNRFPKIVTIIRNEENKGFQDPNKNALRLAKGEFLVLLNNDMEVCEGWLEALALPFEKNRKLAITGLAGTCNHITDDYKASVGKLEYIEGSCLMIPCAIARKIGLFADYLKFIYWEDTDLSLRAQEQGYEIEQVKIDAQHRHRASTTKHMDLREVLAHNKKEFERRWAFYIRRRTFEKRILIRRLGARGDVLLLTPALRALQEKWPQAEIQLQTKCPTMLTGMPGIKMAMESKSYFDYFYDLDLSYEKRPDVHIVQAYADALEVQLPRQWTIEMFPSEKDEAWGLRKSRGMKVALIHAGTTTWPGKNWSLDRMEQVVKHLKAQGFFTIAVGDEHSPSINCDDSVAGKTSPQQLYALAKHASLFVGLDSMPQHVASAANVPSAIMFGPTNPKMILRPTPRIVAVQATTADAECVGAHGRRTKAVTQAPCDGACSRAVTVEMMIKGINRALQFSK